MTTPTRRVSFRYMQYARAQGRTPEDQIAQDRKDWPGGIMYGYTLWNTSRIREFSAHHPEAMFLGRLMDHSRYDAWLVVWVDQYLKGKE